MITSARILVADRDGRGSIHAFVMWFTNAILQRRQVAFDGRTWYCQANKQAPFRPVGEGEVPAAVKEEMQDFLARRYPHDPDQT